MTIFSVARWLAALFTVLSVVVAVVGFASAVDLHRGLAGVVSGDTLLVVEVGVGAFGVVLASLLAFCGSVLTLLSFVAESSGGGL